MRFEEAWGGWRSRRPTQEEAARPPGGCERTACPRGSGGSGATWTATRTRDWTGCWTSARVRSRRSGASVDEVVRTETLYRERYEEWNVKRFHRFYRREHAGERSCTWVKNPLQRAGLVAKAPGRGKHRRRRERAPVAGMMVHQSLPPRRRGSTACIAPNSRAPCTSSAWR